MKSLTEDEIKSLMRTDAYQNKYNPKFEDTQCLVRQGWENIYPEDDRNEHPENYYFWKTSGDSKVRSEHADLDGEVFSWDNPPECGHPGEDYNCRCTAEKYIPPKDKICYMNEEFEKEQNKKIKIEKFKDFIHNDFIHNDLSTTPTQFAGAVYDFGKNVSDLKWSNKDKKSDKFFHCNANCEATKRGKAGEFTSEVLSNVKEEFDQRFKRFPKEDSEEDHIANRYGRSQAKKHPKKKCINLCEDVDKFFVKNKRK